MTEISSAEKEITSCKYCTPDKKGRRKPLDVDKFLIRGKGETYKRYKRNVMKIYRKKNKRKDYFVGVHSKDVFETGEMIRNNGFIIRFDISYCPSCGKYLRRKNK